MIGSPLAVLAAGAAAYLPWLTIAGPDAAVVIGMILIVAGVVRSRHCVYARGASFTGVVAVKQNQRVVESGLYRLVRHPSYTSACMMFTGRGLALGSWISVAILSFAHCYLYGRRIVAEEKALVDTLGDAFTEYML